MILRHTLSYAVAKCTPAAATIATLVIFTHLMSPDQFGLYSLTVNLSTTLVAILGNFLIIGLGRYEPASNTIAEKQQLHSTVVISALLMSILVAALTTTLNSLDLLPSLSVNYFYFCILFAASFFLTLSQTLLNASLKPKLYGLSIAIKSVAFLSTATLCLVMGYGVRGVLLSLVICSLLALLPSATTWSKISQKHFSFQTLKQIWSYGAPLTLLYLFVMVINFSDRIFIDVMLGSDAVGLYSAGNDLTQYSIAVIASIVHLAAFPIILRKYETEGDDKAREAISISTRLLLLLMLPATFGFIAVKNEITLLFLGNEFSLASAEIITPIAFSILLLAIKSYHFDYAFQIKKSTWLQSIPPMIAAALNCLLNYFLIQEFGIKGAAYASLISYTAYLFLAAFLAKLVFELPSFPWRHTIKVCLACSIMIGTIYTSPTDLTLAYSFAAKILIGAIVFFISIYLIMKKEILLLISLANNTRT